MGDLLDVKKSFLKTRLANNPGYQRGSEKAAPRSFKSQRKRGPFWEVRAMRASLALGLPSDPSPGALGDTQFILHLRALETARQVLMLQILVHFYIKT